MNSIRECLRSNSPEMTDFSDLTYAMEKISTDTQKRLTRLESSELVALCSMVTLELLSRFPQASTSVSSLFPDPILMAQPGSTDIVLQNTQSLSSMISTDGSLIQPSLPLSTDTSAPYRPRGEWQISPPSSVSSPQTPPPTLGMTSPNPTWSSAPFSDDWMESIITTEPMLSSTMSPLDLSW